MANLTPTLGSSPTRPTHTIPVTNGPKEPLPDTTMDVMPHIFSDAANTNVMVIDKVHHLPTSPCKESMVTLASSIPSVAASVLPAILPPLATAAMVAIAPTNHPTVDTWTPSKMFADKSQFWTLYPQHQKIERGTYGVVYKVQDPTKPLLDPHASFAVKMQHEFRDTEQGIPSYVLREMSNLRLLGDHPNIVKFLGVDFLTSSSVALLKFEYYPTTLATFLANVQTTPLEPSVIKELLRSLLSAVDYCHKRAILHRDLKPQNIFLSSSHQLKVGDFGLSRFHCLPIRTYTHEVFTLWYRPPEILLGVKSYGPAADMWSVGCLFAEFLSGKPLFPADCEIDCIFRIFRMFGTPTETHAPYLKTLPDYQHHMPKWPPRTNVTEDLFKIPRESPAADLFFKLLAMDPRERISAHDALLHDYFKS